MDLKFYNTESDQKEKFEPLEEGKVKMYVCGTTDYDYIHVGHARTYILYDVIVRFLEYLGYEVKYVQNITDVGHLTEDEGEDKVQKKAEEKKKEPMEIVEHFMTEHLRDVDRLRIRRPDIMPRATGHIIEMQNMVQDIMDNGYAYEKDGTVYFDVEEYAKDYGYGKLRDIDRDQLGESRVDTGDKKNPTDFALWVKASPDHIMNWRSNWSEGYPGWHIECSTMSSKYLGDEFDIHGGAIELSFPHHENEIAQSVAANGKEPVNYWIHTGLVNVGGDKMAKSEGNFTTVKEALDEYSPEVIRLWSISSHYRKPADYSGKNMKEAQDKFKKIRDFWQRLNRTIEMFDKEGEEGDLTDYAQAKKEEIVKELKDDINTPEALASIFELISKINGSIDNSSASKKDLINSKGILNTFLGELFDLLPKKSESNVSKDKLMDLILDVRQELREQGNYDLSDRIRDDLEEIGIELEDEGSDTIWKTTSDFKD